MMLVHSKLAVPSFAIPRDLNYCSVSHWSLLSPSCSRCSHRVAWAVRRTRTAFSLVGRPCMQLVCARCLHPYYSICYCASALAHTKSFVLRGGSIWPLGSSVYSCSYQAMAAHVASLELIDWQEAPTTARAFEGLDSVRDISFLYLWDLSISQSFVVFAVLVFVQTAHCFSHGTLWGPALPSNSTTYTSQSRRRHVDRPTAVSFASIVAIKRCSLMDSSPFAEQLTAERLGLNSVKPLAVVKFSLAWFSLLQH